MATKYSFNITDLSYDTLLAQARALATTYFPNWDFDNPNDLGRFALDIHLHGVDRALWLANAWAGEWNMLTAKERKHVEARALALGYPLKSRVASQGTIDLTFVTNASPRTVSQYQMRFSVIGDDGEMVYYENANSFSIGANITQLTAGLIEGKSFEQIEIGTGRAFQEFLISSANVIEGSVKITVDGVSWTQVVSFAESTDTSPHYVVEYLGDNSSRVIFGDGEYGAIPALNSAITIDCRIGGGIRGNVVANSILTVEATPYPVEIRGSMAMNGGQDLEPLYKIQLLAPRFRRAYDRLLSALEIETYVTLLPGVERCLVTLTNRAVTVYLVPTGGGYPNSALVSLVSDSVVEKLLIGYSLNVTNPNYKSVAITITGTKNPGYLDAEVIASVQAALLARLSSVNVDGDGNYINDFDEDLTVQAIRDAVTATACLQADFVVNVPTGTITVAATELLTPTGSVITVNLV